MLRYRTQRSTVPVAGMAFACLWSNHFALCCPDQTKTGTASVKTERILKQGKHSTPCVPEWVPGPTHGPPQEFKFRKGESYRRSPVVSYQVEPDGNVTNVKLIRGTGVKDIDTFVVDWVKKQKYKCAAPECAAIDVEMTVTIDFW